MNEVYATQGGGFVKWEELNKAYVFVTSPPDFPNYQPGDFMPEEWGITGPISTLSGANLSEAYLRGANLRDDLGGTD